MKKFSIKILIFAIVFLGTACGVRPGLPLPTATAQPANAVIISQPITESTPVEEGTQFAGSGSSSDQILKIEADGRYRVDWAIAAPNGGRVELINKDASVDVMFRRVILSNLIQPSEGYMDVALTAGEYILQVNVDGNWSYRFSLVQQMDF